jgi:hypothetical protein
MGLIIRTLKQKMQTSKTFSDFISLLPLLLGI